MESSSSSAMAAEKRKPRTPGEDSEVIALSPASLTAANRFFCDVCGKGFQREQNLQLHRRSHSLPWGLKQRAGGNAAGTRRRVYVCPVPSCPHHDPSKALGDLSGIKKHFCRKHGEKKFSCHRCGKKYAVQSDIRAHAKICGTKTYHCDCGAMFNKWNDFARHTVLCGLILAQPIVETPPVSGLQPPPQSLTLSMAAAAAPSEFPASQCGNEETLDASAGADINKLKVVGDSPASTSSAPARQSLMTSKSMESDFFGALMEPTNLPLSFLCSPHHDLAAATNNASSSHQYLASPALSATALLQKAAQVGSIYSGGSTSFLHGLGLSMMSGFNNTQKWNGYAMPENKSMGSSGGLPDSMVDRASPAVIFSTQQLQTLDFLGVGGGNGNDGGVFGRLGFP
ncbi:zinc finger protein GAI-ASSOCIATED FACTOR 1-like [Ipomoea triloba]|uniref:zinc finger protein GAI-ASSOCIATED FACTOR 1-like n=1 Tax=Ipomoea triloba TaxID=35885 RepID=UPI00125E73CD|nr:zinc finger protein GAI-ASSOCIATED FACTOR 1-like [Ipomoea triloba]